MRQHAVLVPGFFGFANLGDLAYFGHVAHALRTGAAARGVVLDVTVVPTEPTASLRRRAGVLAETILAAVPRDDEPVHVVGHSSGGLDARLLIARDAALTTEVEVERAATRVRSVVTVATPHHGTPLADLFSSLMGQQLLRVLSLGTIYLLRFGHLPLAVVLELIALLTRLNRATRVPTGLLDEIVARLLGDFSIERRDALVAFLGAVEADQSLLPQLTPAAMELFTAGAQPPPGTRIGSVAVLGQRPTILGQLGAGLDASAQATHAVYQALYRATARGGAGCTPEPTPEHADGLRTAYGSLPDATANDGVVPTRSQLWGTLVHAARGDHLDVLGHFRDRTPGSTHVDWLASGSAFDRRAFEGLWAAVLAFALGPASREGTP